MSVACTVAQSQERAFNPRMLSKFFSTMVKTASLALGEIPSVPEKVQRLGLPWLELEGSLPFRLFLGQADRASDAGGDDDYKSAPHPPRGAVPLDNARPKANPSIHAILADRWGKTFRRTTLSIDKYSIFPIARAVPKAVSSTGIFLQR